MNQEQFTYMLTLFPAILVVLSDGIVDKGEWTSIQKMSRILGDEFSTPPIGKESDIELSEIYRKEFRYLLRNRLQWEERFIEGLLSYFSENPVSKDFVMETMYLFANASHGISKYEQKAIEDLTVRLKLAD